jgi:hypothetical protein
VVDGLAEALVVVPDEVLDGVPDEVLGETPAEGLAGVPSSPVEPQPASARTTGTVSTATASRRVPEEGVDTFPVFTPRVGLPRPAANYGYCNR